MRRGPIIGFFCFVFVIDYFLYFRHAGHFFQADSVFLLGSRATSLSGFFRDFIVLHPSGFYRPLANEVIESILFPIFGLNPIPYRIPLYALFLADTAAVYALTFRFTRKHLAAAFATFFFSIHTTVAYTTFDIGFAPELQYTLFYIGSVLAYLRYLQKKTRAAYLTSLACFAASLLSKEAAVTLPGTLLVLHILMEAPSTSLGARFLHAVRYTLPHALVLVLYLALAIGYLHVMNFDIAKIFDRPEQADGNSYKMVLDSAVLTNADVALSWAFNLPRGWWGQWYQPSEWMTAFLRGFRLFALALMALLLLTPDRKAVLAGLSWFVLTLIPALPLANHFIPYYLFLPVVGLSLAVGASLSWACERVGARKPLLAAVIISTVLGVMFYVRSERIHAELRENRLLGGSAELAFNSLTDLKRLYPTLPARATIYIDDAAEPIAWDHSWGGLIKMAYGVEDVSVLFASEGDALLPDATLVPAILVLKFENKRIVDKTSAFRSDPTSFIQYKDSKTHELVLSKNEVTAGRDYYDLSIEGLRNEAVRIAYIRDDGPLEVFTGRVDDRGQMRFDVSAATTKGVYRFVGFNISGERDWFRSGATILVR